MNAAWTITKREFGAYFKSPIGYIVITLFLGFAGVLYFQSLFLNQQASLEAYFGRMPLLFLFFGPAVAMRLLAEERGSGTIEMLLTLPVTDGAVVLGKFAAAVGLLAVTLLLSLPIAFTVRSLGPMDWGPTLGGYAGTLLLGATYLAIGLFASAMTRNQIVAFIVGFSLCLGLFLIDVAAQDWSGTPALVLQYMTPRFHFESMTRGVIELRSVIYYLSTIGVALLLTVQVLESRKWR